MRRAAIGIVAAAIVVAAVVAGEVAGRTKWAGTAVETSFYSKGVRGRLRRDDPRPPPPRRVRRRRVLERLLPPDEPGRNRAAERRVGRRERACERAHLRVAAARGVQPPADLLRLLRRRGRHALP